MLPSVRLASFALVVLCLASLPRLALAGAQAEEPLADSVRTALSSAIGRSAPA